MSASARDARRKMKQRVTNANDDSMRVSRRYRRQENSERMADEL